ncbi:antiterminator LoaP [Treponema putidum]|uniref:Antiterminator LoaP n=1 Tax=Treponema putidum TaxID=221027 RepID=A0ABY5HQB9_9SPIR|nr:antiterminator LoaP [Treponema putidum]UTY27683.1 antiterminator LoaP [Treponema putidum]UTY30145.1 antiterminator LoaP [Treponema putidum]
MDYYVVQVSTGKEKKFIEDAESKNKFDEIPYSIVFPQRVLKIRKAGKVTEKQLAVFAGYLFIGTDGISRELYQHIKKCKGFYRFLPNNQEPKSLQGRDLEILNQFISFGGVAKISQVIFDENDRIKIIEGPLSGLEGYIVRVNKRKERATICLDMCETSFSIDLGFEEISKEKKKNEPSY